MDAPAGSGLTGLGKKCTGTADCPANASACIGFTQGKLFCSPLCEMNGTGTTNAQGQFPTTGTGALNPQPSNATCTGAYNGTTGSPVCAGILSTTPMDNPLKPNTQYTMVTMGCAIVCGTGSTCPMGMTCNTGIGPGICEPM